MDRRRDDSFWPPPHARSDATATHRLTMPSQRRAFLSTPTETMDPLDELSRLAGTSVSGLGGSADVPRNSSMQELRAAGEFVRGETESAPSIHAQSANPFLSDLPTLRSTSNVSKTISVEETRYRTPEERINEHIDNLVNDCTKNQQEETRRLVDDLYEKRVQKAHDARMKRYVAELHGNRTLGGSFNTTIPLSSMSLSVTQDLDPAQVSPYLQTVYMWNRSPQTPLGQVLLAFLNLTTTTADSCAWKMLESIIASSHHGALSFYCHQFADIVRTRVREATAAGQDTSMPYSLSNGMAQIVASYVKLTTNIKTSPWPIVYYCLRCGDATAALNVLDATNNQANPFVRRILAALSQAQGNFPCLWNAATPPVISAVDRQAAADLYDRTKHQDSTDPFHLACLALLSVRDSEAILSSPIMKTTEDYMFVGLWYALQQTSPHESIAELGKNIQELGPTSFPPETEWAFALPLMASRQYRAALTHVGKTNLVQATHVAMVLKAGGVDLRDFGSTDQTSCLLTSFLLDYSKQLQQKDSLAAIEYLARIPSKKRAETEVARLVVETQKVNELDRPLQELFVGRVSSIFVEAAEQARTRGNAHVAADLFFRAGRDDLLLSLLNHQLALEMVGGIENAEWHSKALHFHKEYLANGNDSQVMRILEETGAKGQLETFQILMDLCHVFEWVRTKDYGRAWDRLEQLPLLPSSAAECTTLARQYSSLDPAIKQVFPVVLEKAMESLSHLYSRLKTSYGQSAMQEQERLRNRARLLLFNFSSALQREIPGSVIARMETIEKSMM